MGLAFLLNNGIVLVLALAAAAGAGTLALGTREGLAFRGAFGLMLCAHALFFLALLGGLRPVPIVALLAIAIGGGIVRGRGIAPRNPVLLLVFALPFAMALFPSFAFDETLYHLPFVQAFARDGAIRFLPDLRFPVFPVLHELLCVPAFLAAGEAGTHLIALAELLLTAALLFEWGSQRDRRAGWLAAAIFLGSPLVIHLGTILYVDAALALFIAAGFYALTRERYALSGLFLGSACSVKYLGLYFAAAALLYVALRHRRALAAFAFACASAALPMTAWIAFHTHNPVFPFFGSSLWTLATPPVGLPDRLIRFARMFWDMTFARQRIGWQPPVTPLLIPIVLLTIRGKHARRLAALCVPYLIVFSFLPQDARYLVPLLPLVSVAAALYAAMRWPKAAPALATLAIAPGLAYAAYRLAIHGLPPATPAARSAWVATRIPETRALRLAGGERVYACGGERLKGYAEGKLFGDFNGPYSYDRVLGGASTTSAIAARMRRIDVPYFLRTGAQCGQPALDGGMSLVYRDEHAELWRVLDSRVARLPGHGGVVEALR